jgi:zinc protease
MKGDSRLLAILLPVIVLGLARPEAAEADDAARLGPSAPANLKPATYARIQRLTGETSMAVLNNGLTVLVEENHAAPVATVRCFVKNTGSAFEGRNLGAGVSHVLERVVSGGTTARHTEKEIEQLVASFGGVANAATSTDMTDFSIDCPAKNVLTAIGLLADSMQRVKFEPAEVERALKVVRRELADDELDRQQVLATLLQATVYSTHPARYPVTGYLDVLNSTTNRAIVDFYRERYIPNNQVFVVVGDVSTAEVLGEIARQYAGTPRGRETYVALDDEPDQLAPREAIREMAGTTCELALAWPTVKLASPDLYPLDVAAYILGEGESSRLVQRLKYDKRLALGVSAASETPHYVAGMFAVLATTRPETFQRASDEILREVYRLREELVRPDELAKAKKQKVTELVLGRQTVQQAAESLARNLITAADPLFDKTYIEGVRKVTAQQVREVARRYFVPERLNRVVIVPPGAGPKTGDGRARAGDGEIHKEVLPNGLRVLVKHDAHLPLVNLQVFVLGGSLADKSDTAGRAMLLAAMLDKGTGDRSAQEIAEFFDSIGAQVSIGAGRFAIHGSLTALREDFPPAAAVLAECFTRPAFPDSEFAGVQQLALAAIARRVDDPHEELMELVCESLPPDSPYHVMPGGTDETVRRLTVRDLKRYAADYFVPNNMVVTVFGDLAAAEAVDLVRKHFGGLKRAADFPGVSFDRPNALSKTIVRHKSIGKDTAMVCFAYPTAGIFDRKGYAAATLLKALMSGYGTPGGWLFNELRGQGLVYSVEASQMTGPAPGYFAIFAQTRADKLEEVTSRIERSVNRARSGRVSDQEFRTAARMVTALMAQENTTLAGQAEQAGLDELWGLGFDDRPGFEKRIEALKLADVVQAARRSFRANHLLITTSPEKRAGIRD